MSIVACWVPEDSLRQERATRQIRRELDDWSAKWFIGGRCEIAGSWDVAREVGEFPSLLLDAGACRLSGKKNSVIAIALVMLNETDRPDFTPADLRLMRKLTGDALDDLAGRLEAIFPNQAGVGTELSDSIWTLEVRLDGKPCLELSLEKNALSRMVKRNYSPVMKKQPLDRLSTVLEGVTVPVFGLVGSTSIELDQVTNLEPGDVLLLDQFTDQSVILTIAGRNSPLRGMITETDGALGLTLSE